MPKRERRKRSKTLDYAAYIGARLFAMFVHMFSWEANYRTGKFLGNMMYALDSRHRNRAMEHLRLSFPDWPEEKRRNVARASMRNMFYLAIEFLFTTRLITPGRWRKHITLVNMDETIRLLLEQERGLIMLTGHFGNWEVVGYTVATLGMPTYSVARRLANPYLDEYVFGVRERTGQIIIDKRGAAAVAPEMLQEKKTICFIADQDAGKKGIFVDFFNRPASTYKAIGLLAMQHNVPVVVGYGQRVNEQYNFIIGIQKVIHPEDWAREADPLRYITQEYTTALEQVVRMAPEQYLWTHRRWKHRPKGEKTE